MSFCIRTVNDDLVINEDFIGLYETPNTESQTLFIIVKDVFAGLDLSMEHLKLYGKYLCSDMYALRCPLSVALIRMRDLLVACTSYAASSQPHPYSMVPP